MPLSFGSEWLSIEAIHASEDEMKRTLAATMGRLMAAAAAAMLAGCGGGGGNPGGAANVAPPTPAPTQQLAGYVGTWVADCAGRSRETDVITQIANGSISINARLDYFSADNCSGFVIATQTQSSDLTATYTGSADASIALPPATTASAIRVDLVTATLGPYTVSVSGTGVTRRTSDGVPAWCVNFAPGDATCIPDQGPQPGSSASAALYLTGNQLYKLTPTSLTYTVTQHLTK